MMHQDAMVEFKQNLRGRLTDRAHADYDEARKLYNAMVDKLPLMIVQCADVADVIAAVASARAYSAGRHPGRRP
jgi:hypothetical protein